MPLIMNGTTIPENIANVLNYNGTNITQVIYNGTTVWTQSLVVVYSMAMIFGGYNKSGNYNTLTRINSSGALVGSETNIGTHRAHLGGAPIGSYGVYVHGNTGMSGTVVNKITRANSSGALVGSETTGGTTRGWLTGAPLDAYGWYHGGGANNASYTTVLSKVDSAGTVLSESNVFDTRNSHGSARADIYAVFYAGLYAWSGSSSLYDNKVWRLNSSGAQVGSSTTAGTARSYLAGAAIDIYAVFYNGGNPNVTNKITRINSSGTMVGSETSAGTTRNGYASGSVGSYGLYYSGNASTTYYNIVTRINSSGTLVGSETSIGTTKTTAAGASAV